MNEEDNKESEREGRRRESEGGKVIILLRQGEKRYWVGEKGREKRVSE